MSEPQTNSTDSDNIIDLKTIKAEEVEYIKVRRDKAEIKPGDPDNDAIGLALSAAESDQRPSTSAYYRLCRVQDFSRRSITSQPFQAAAI
jgi:hypothetical protein